MPGNYCGPRSGPRTPYGPAGARCASTSSAGGSHQLPCSATSTGPALLDLLAESATLATLVGEHTRLLWPADYDLRRIAVHDPTPVDPHSLIWHRDNPHPALTALREYLGARQPRHRGPGTWAPAWAQPPGQDGFRTRRGEISRPLAPAGTGTSASATKFEGSGE